VQEFGVNILYYSTSVFKHWSLKCFCCLVYLRIRFVLWK